MSYKSEKEYALTLLTDLFMPNIINRIFELKTDLFVLVSDNVNNVIVDSNLFDDVKLLQTGLSCLNDTLFNVVEGLPYQYANLMHLQIYLISMMNIKLIIIQVFQQ
jgi:hypothetical protein